MDFDKTHAAVRPLAQTALVSAIKEDWPQARNAVQAINSEHGGSGMLIAVTAWIDTCIVKMGVDTSKPIHLSWMELDSGRIDTDADQVPPTVRWAGRVVAARAALDKAAFDALIRALPDDPWTVGEHVGVLLQMTALNIRNVDKIRAAADSIEPKDIGR